MAKRQPKLKKSWHFNRRIPWLKRIRSAVLFEPKPPIYITGFFGHANMHIGCLNGMKQSQSAICPDFSSKEQDSRCCDSGNDYRRNYPDGQWRCWGLFCRGLGWLLYSEINCFKDNYGVLVNGTAAAMDVWEDMGAVVGWSPIIGVRENGYIQHV